MIQWLTIPEEGERKREEQRNNKRLRSEDQ